MSPLARNILRISALLVLSGALVPVYILRGRERGRVTCRELRITIADSASRSFVSEQDVRSYMQSYGTFIGQRIDSVDLCRIERILDGESAIRKSEACITSDGELHVMVTQRVPIVRFQQGSSGFYADEDCFIFPLQSRFTARVPIVDGALPIARESGYKGEATGEKERQWLMDMVGLIKELSRSRLWADNITQITVLGSGDLVLVPREGRERFLFGPPHEVAPKLRKMEDYYRYIVPEKGRDHYATVDLRFGGRIVCRTGKN